MFPYTSDTYWELWAYERGRLSVLNCIRHLEYHVRKAIRESERCSLKYQTMALVSEDRDKLNTRGELNAS